MSSLLRLRKLAPSEFRNRSVLIVDESPYTRKLLVDMSRALELRQVVTAISPADAIDMLQIVMFDFVICHWTQPPLDGPRFVACLRASENPALKRVPIILVSGDPQAKGVDCGEAGMIEVLSPPFSMQALAQKLESVIL